ncbi:MAG TPA: single-stranded DNA-binding protein [Bdellovibrionota bacterium]|nr:single-stranded DNA-binding protein [Bdellovibrionota bacterium]
MNKAILLGRLGHDPVLRETKKGTPVAHFSVATAKWVKVEGEEAPSERTQWHNITAWGTLARTCQQQLAKGSTVYVEGSFHSHTYKAKDGVMRQSSEVYADRVSFLNGRASKGVSVPAAATVPDLAGEAPVGAELPGDSPAGLVSEDALRASGRPETLPEADHLAS